VNRLINILVCFVAACAVASAQTAFLYEGRDKNELNPILRGFYPDPSICTDGKDYYLVNSSFSFFPAVPIFKSSDLSKWESLGHVLDRESQVDLRAGGVSDGIFAPSIRYHNGLFYMVTMNMSNFTVFYVTTDDPAKGWSEPVYLKRGGMDPSFFFDGDKAYLLFTTRPRNQTYPEEMAIGVVDFDILSGQVSGEPRELLRGKWIEGPHVYKIDNQYFLMCAEGGTDANHSETIYRSSSIDGQWEKNPSNPILSEAKLGITGLTSVGHADLIQDRKGEWKMVFLGCRPYEDDYYNTGRETFMLPVEWVDGWPVVVAEKSSKHPKFRYRSDLKTFGSEWEYLRYPGYDNTVYYRQQHKNFRIRTVLSAAADTAGVVFFQNENYRIDFAREGDELVLRCTENGVSKVESCPVSSEKLQIEVVGRGRYYSFRYKTNKWKTMAENVDASLLSTHKAGGYIGTMIGVYEK